MALLQTTTAEGALKGMILARAPHELNDQECAYLQDAIINQPGFVNRRGAITGTTVITAANLDSARPDGIATVYAPDGTQKIVVFYFKDTGAAIELWMAVFTPALVFIQKHYIATQSSYPNRWSSVHSAPGIDGSLIISMRYNFPGDPITAMYQFVAKWYGGCSTTSVGSGALPTATIATTEGSTSVTGGVAEIAKISFPGTIVQGFGVVSKITSTTQIELKYPATRTQAATATNYMMVENLGVMRNRGGVSCAAGVLSGLTGYGTRFTESKDRATIAGSGFTFLDGTTMKKLADLTSGAVAPAVSDTLSGVPTGVARSASLKNYLLYANEALSDNYFNRHVPIAPNPNFAPSPKSAKGSFFASYKGYMISFNSLVSATTTDDAGDILLTSRAFVHGPRFPEIMDHSVDDGDWFDVLSTKAGDSYGVAVVSGADAVVLCKVLESFALTGDSPENFTLRKIADDGALGYDAVASWRGMPIWVGRTGIWMYDAANSQAVNILDNTIGAKWKDYTAAYDVNGTTADSDKERTHQCHAFVYKDYLFVNVMHTGSTFSVYTDGVSRTQNPMQLMIYLPTMACTFLTNFNFQGFVQVGTAGYVILPQLGSTTHHFFPVDNLFTQGTALDTILTANSYNSGTVSTSVGPWFHMESRKFAAGDGLWRKTWKQLSIEFLMTSTKRMFLETVAGLNTTGVRQPIPYVGTGLFVAFKNKFNARDQYMSFRLYEDINNRPATLKLGAWQWAYKLARRGQV